MKKPKLKKVAHILEIGDIGQPNIIEAFRRKIVFDPQNVTIELGKLQNFSRDQIMQEIAEYPDLLDIFLMEPHSNHLQIDSRQVALIIEIANRTIQKYNLAQKATELYHWEHTYSIKINVKKNLFVIHAVTFRIFTVLTIKSSILRHITIDFQPIRLYVLRFGSVRHSFPLVTGGMIFYVLSDGFRSH